MTDIDTTTDPSDDRGPLRNRRGFFAFGGAAAAAAVLAACGSDDDGDDGVIDDGGTPTTEGAADDTTTSTTEGATEADPSADLVVAALAASLELLAVNTYTAAGEAAGSGALGEVPPAVVEFVTVASDHHQQALDAWNGVLTGAGETEVTETPAELQGVVDEAFAAVTDTTGAAQLALTLEQTAAQTYLAALAELTDPAAIELAGSIMPVAQQHAAVLLFVLGEYPVPDTFVPTDMAATPG